MHAPFYSTVTLIAELFVSSVIYFVIYQGFKNNRFFTKLAFFALFYEIVFKISYMVSRVPSQTKATKAESPFLIIVAILHGTLSLAMFLALIIFFVIAWRKYRKEINFFKERKALTYTFLLFWTISIISGVLFYTIDYLL